MEFFNHFKNGEGGVSHTGAGLRRKRNRYELPANLLIKKKLDISSGAASLARAFSLDENLVVEERL